MRGTRSWKGYVCAAAALLAGCSGEKEPATPWWEQVGPGEDLPADPSAAARFLTQGTFGTTADDLEGLQFAGFDGWFEYQTTARQTLHRPRLEARERAGEDVFQSARQEVFWDVSVNGPDQLRQRMAFALSQIFVVSDRAGNLGNRPIPLAHYYDMLGTHAFGSFRALMEDVTKSPVMGLYLSHLRNRRGDPANNIRPDENYARELMQLFTVGLFELLPDGTPRLDGGGQEIPVYTQDDIENLSRVLTGWALADSGNFWGGSDYISSMVPFEQYHDGDAKVLLGGQVIPAGLDPEADLDAALDIIFQHPNVPPFISRQLIQRLVTSNPSPAYVGRVAAVFTDNGEGERGDLGAVVRAILMDDEAREGHLAAPDAFGKVREPIVRMAGLWRAFDGRAATGRYRYRNPQNDLGQAALRSPSVFNFFYPGYEPQGPVEAAGLVAPELQIVTHTSITRTANAFHDRIFRAYPGFGGTNQDTVTLDLSDELELAGDPAALVDHLDLLLMSGQMSADMRATLVAHLENTAIDAGNKADGMQRVLDGIYLVITSPEGAVQR